MTDIELVAGFMEINLSKSEYFNEKGKNIIYYLSNSNIEEPIIYSPDSDWNQLMVIVEKIESIKCDSCNYYSVDINRGSVYITTDVTGFRIDTFKYHAGKKINATFKACVEFIKEYNKIKE